MQSFFKAGNTAVLDLRHLRQITLSTGFLKGLARLFQRPLDVSLSLRGCFFTLPNLIKIRVFALQLLQRELRLIKTLA